MEDRWRREDNIKIDLKEIRCEGVDSNQLLQERIQWPIFVNRVNDVLRSIECGVLLGCMCDC
jgi:hypothetical protein